MHDGVTHMKTLVTSTYATNASSNFGPNWQRDHDYFVAKATKPAIYQAIAIASTYDVERHGRASDRWSSRSRGRPRWSSPANSATGVATTTSLVWNIARVGSQLRRVPGHDAANMTLVGNVPAQMVTNPPTTYSFTPSLAAARHDVFLEGRLAHQRDPARPVDDRDLVTWSFTTAGAVGPPPAPTNPSPSSGAIGVSTAPALGWSAGATGTTFNVAFGTTNPPPQVASGLTTAVVHARHARGATRPISGR